MENDLNQASQDDVFLTESELATRHKKSVKTLRNARVNGDYIQFVRCGRNIRYRLSDILAYERSRTMTSTSNK